MGMEIEKKFTIKQLPADLDKYDHHMIEQAYLTTSPTIRVRREDDRYYMTYKGVGSSNTSLSHEEYNLPLTAEAYETIRKKRVLIPCGSHTIELDIFDEPFRPLIIAEVEFPSVEEAEAFVPPGWFDEEVTDRWEYRNAYLALGR